MDRVAEGRWDSIGRARAVNEILYSCASPHQDAMMLRHNEDMRTTVDLDPAALKIAKAVARSRKMTLGSLMSKLILDYFQPKEPVQLPIGTTDLGLPAIFVGRPVTPEDVAAAVEEE